MENILPSSKKLLKDLKVTDLKIQLEKRNCVTSGVKAVLVDRLSKQLEKEGKCSETFAFDVDEETKRHLEEDEEMIIECLKKKENDENTESQDVVDEVGQSENDAKYNDDKSVFSKGSVAQKEHENEEEKSKKNGHSSSTETLPEEDSINLMIEDEEYIFAEDQRPSSPKTVFKKGREEEVKSSEAAATTTESVETVLSGKKTTVSTSLSSVSERNLWVSGLASSTRATDLKTVFSKYGKVVGAKVVTNARTPGARCYGYITMNHPEEASKCIQHLNNTELHERNITVEKAKVGEAVPPTIRKSPYSKEELRSSRHRSKECQSDESSSRKDLRSILPPKSTSRLSRADISPRRSESSPKPGILSFSEIRFRQREKDEERRRIRERRRFEEEEHRRRDLEKRRRRHEEEKITKEREKLRFERERLEREKAELLKLERERQKYERERLLREKEELERLMRVRREEENRRLLKHHHHQHPQNHHQQHPQHQNHHHQGRSLEPRDSSYYEERKRGRYASDVSSSRPDERLNRFDHASRLISSRRPLNDSEYNGGGGGRASRSNSNCRYTPWTTALSKSSLLLDESIVGPLEWSGRSTSTSVVPRPPIIGNGIVGALGSVSTPFPPISGFSAPPSSGGSASHYERFDAYKSSSSSTSAATTLIHHQKRY